MLSEKDLTWDNFSFPNIKFVPFDVGFIGLCQAVFERMTAIGKNVEEHDFFKYCYQKRLNYSMQQLVTAFDNLLFNEVAPRFMNHTVADFEDVNEFSSLPYWNIEGFEKYFKANSDKIGFDLPHGLSKEKFDLLPGYLWAFSRYHCINLLLYLPINYQGKFFTGSVHNGEPMSPTAAVQAAFDSAKISDAVLNPLIKRSITTIWGPDHGWKYGSYCCDLYEVGALKAVLPENVPSDIDVKLYCFFDSPDGSNEYWDSMGTGISKGLKIFEADKDLNFTQWELPGTPDKVRIPTAGKTRTFGFVSRAVCVGNFESLFKFKAKEE